MVPLSTFSCCPNVNVSVQSIQAPVVCKTPLVGFLGFSWTHSCYPYIFKFRDARCRFDCRHNVEGGEQTMGREWPDLGGPALAYAQESPTRRDPYFCSPMRGSHRKPTQHSFCQLLLRKTLVDDTCIALPWSYM